MRVVFQNPFDDSVCMHPIQKKTTAHSQSRETHPCNNRLIKKEKVEKGKYVFQTVSAELATCSQHKQQGTMSSTKAIKANPLQMHWRCIKLCRRFLLRQDVFLHHSKDMAGSSSLLFGRRRLLGSQHIRHHLREQAIQFNKGGQTVCYSSPLFLFTPFSTQL